MTAPFPHHYEVKLKRLQGSDGTLSAGTNPALEGGSPLEFGGQGGRWSPEHLLLASVNLCLMNTFVAVSEKSKLNILDYQSKAEGTLDKTAQGLVFTEMTISAAVKVADEDKERATRLMETAKKYCIISNSLKNPVNLKVLINE